MGIQTHLHAYCPLLYYTGTSLATVQFGLMQACMYVHNSIAHLQLDGCVAIDGI